MALSISFPTSLLTKATQVLENCIQKNWTLATAESCTGGLLGALLTDIPGASRAYGFGYVTYSNAAKHHVLGVARDILQTHGAVSEPTVVAMAQGAKRLARAQLSCAISGIAGPSGGQADKPVGTVYIAIAWADDQAQAQRFQFDGNRNQIRSATLEAALTLLQTQFQA